MGLPARSAMLLAMDDPRDHWLPIGYNFRRLVARAGPDDLATISLGPGRSGSLSPLRIADAPGAQPVLSAFCSSCLGKPGSEATVSESIPRPLTSVSDEIIQVVEGGVQICIVVGGGNIFRGETSLRSESSARAPTTWACWPR